MTDKFFKYYDGNEEKIRQLSEYVHRNFHIILTKMISETRRKLDIKPDLENSEGYVSLMVSLYGRMLNEIIYGLAGICQSFKIKPQEIVPIDTFKILLDLMDAKNPLNGRTRTDIREITKKERDEYYLKYIEELRSHIDALPQD